VAYTHYAAALFRLRSINGVGTGERVHVHREDFLWRPPWPEHCRARSKRSNQRRTTRCLAGGQWIGSKWGHSANIAGRTTGECCGRSIARASGVGRRPHRAQVSPPAWTREGAKPGSRLPTCSMDAGWGGRGSEACWLVNPRLFGAGPIASPA
jgi:hypothetical protein